LQSRPVHQQCRNGFDEAGGAELGLLNHQGRIALGQRLGVAPLMIVGCGG
jgi:hypothetical protein